MTDRGSHYMREGMTNNRERHRQYIAVKASIQHVTSFLGEYISKGAIDMFLVHSAT